MYTLNKKLRDLTPYDPITGSYAVRLDANESYFTADEALLAEIKAAISEIEFNRYPDPYCKTLCKHFAAYYGISPDAVTVGNGSDEMLNVITGSFLEKGDKLLTLDPDFSMYAFYGELLEADVVTMPKNEDLSIDVDAVIEYANQNAVKAILFSNPCNPTSLGLDRERVRRLIRGVNALVILDEAYMDFYDQTLIQEITEYDNAMLLRTCSKALGMAGIRLGFVVANPTITNALRAAKSPYNVNSVTQAIGIAVFKRPAELRAMTDAIIRSRKALQKGIEALCKYNKFDRVYPSDANFVFIKTAYAKEIYTALLDRSIAIRFMKGQYLRITAGSEFENKTLLTELEDILGGLGA